MVLSYSFPPKVFCQHTICVVLLQSVFKMHGSKFKLKHINLKKEMSQRHAVVCLCVYDLNQPKGDQISISCIISE